MVDFPVRPGLLILRSSPRHWEQLLGAPGRSTRAARTRRYLLVRDSCSAAATSSRRLVIHQIPASAAPAKGTKSGIFESTRYVYPGRASDGKLAGSPSASKGTAERYKT